MQKIKYRAWDNEEKRMIDINFWNYDRFVWMQYTGLKDKNGKEIFGGDIVCFEWQHDGSVNYDYEVTGVVEWDSELCQFRIFYKKSGEMYSCPMQSFDREEMAEDSLEVIGNIYQDSHLLEEGK